MQPTPYMRAADFSDPNLDSEFEAIEVTLSEVLRQLALLQRDDDALQDGLVTPNALAESTVAAMTAQVSPRGDWATATVYTAGDVTRNGGNIYLCFVDHTSGTFATDLAADYWEQIGTSAPLVTSVFGRTGTVLGASGDYDASDITNDSGVAGANVAAALDVLSGSKQNALGYTPVNKSGDTMSGALSLPASNPTDDNHASRKEYVDLIGRRTILSGSFLCPHKNLKMDWASNTTFTLSAAALILENSSGDTLRIDSLSVTLDKTATVGSPLGLDTGTWSAGWYSVWGIAKADGTKSAVFSAADPNASGTPNLSSANLTDYTFYGYCGSVYWNGSAFTKLYQRDNFVNIAYLALVSSGSATTVTAVSNVTTTVPTTARSIIGRADAINLSGGANGDPSVSLYPDSGGVTGLQTIGQNNTNSSAIVSGNFEIMFTTPQTFYYINNNGTDYRATIYASAFRY